MGSAKRRTKKYVRPPMQWNTERIEEEGALRKEFGLKNAKEVWKAKAELRRIRGNARKLLALGDDGSDESERMLKRVERYGLIKKEEERENTLDDLLQLDVRNLLERRLQTRVMKKGLALTAKQARQLITHGFISIDGIKVTIPSYMVSLEADEKIGYYKNIDISPKVQDVVTPQVKEENKDITRPLPKEKLERIEERKKEESQRDEVKEEVKEEKPKEEVKETTKEEVKEEKPKEEVKETQKEEVKEEKPKEEVKETQKEEAEEKKDETPKVENKGESNE
jgi:small subunit ribosomal protein S4